VNFLGKAFTMIILVMSVIFMSLSIMVFATHRNWKVKAETLEKELAKQVAMSDSAKEERDNALLALAREQAARKSHVAVLATAAEQANLALADASKTNTAVLADLNTQSTANGLAMEQLTDLTVEVTRVRDQLTRSRADRDLQYTSAVKLTDDVNRLQTDLDTLVARHDNLSREAAQMQLALNINGIDPTVLAAIPPSVKGEVLESRNEFIEISIGSDDGIRESHHIEVYRDALYLGRAIIRQTAPDRSVAQVLVNFRKGVIKKGDRVSTKTN
jgi:hypothetical protein